jgi:hypothetical protein
VSALGGGPWVQMAVLCERVIEGKDGALSIIRAVDEVTLPVHGPAAPATVPVVPLQTWLAVTVRAGAALGKHKLSIRMQTPQGSYLESHDYDMDFEKPESGINVVVQLRMQLKNQGLYWFEVLVDDTLATVVPLRVNYAYEPAEGTS